MPSPTSSSGHGPAEPEIRFEYQSYEGVSRPLGLTIRDRAATGSIRVRLSAGGEAAEEELVLEESAGERGVFLGAIQLERVFTDDGRPLAEAGNGKVAVYAEGSVRSDTITARYLGVVASVPYSEPASTLTGVVQVTGQPAAGALVLLYAGHTVIRRGSSRGDGAYAFHDLNPGAYTLTAKVQGTTQFTRNVTIQ